MAEARQDLLKGPSSPTKSGISGPAGMDNSVRKPGFDGAPTKHYPSTNAMVPKRANVIDGAGKGKGIVGDNGVGGKEGYQTKIH